MPPTQTNFDLLTVIRLNEFLAHLDCQAAMEDRRRDLRYPIHGPVMLGAGAGADDCVDEGAESKALCRGWATDISYHGMALLVAQELPAGTHLAIDMQALAGHQLILPLRVSYCQQILPEAYRVGGAFLLHHEADRPMVG